MTKSTEGLHDPFYVLVRPREEPALQRGHVALVVIDLQYLDAHPSGWMGRLAHAQEADHVLAQRWEAIDKMLGNVADLQGAFRGAGQEVVHVRTGARTRDARDAGRAYIPDLQGSGEQRDARDDEFLVEIAPADDELVFSKTSSSVFNSTDIDAVLKRMGLTQLVFAGIVTDGCVELAARDAADRGYEVVLATDACAATIPSTHALALQRMTETGFIFGWPTSRITQELGRL